jgi:hypothetical protein
MFRPDICPGPSSGATLADGGVNSVNGSRVVKASVCPLRPGCHGDGRGFMKPQVTGFTKLGCPEKAALGWHRNRVARQGRHGTFAPPLDGAATA